ncbi:unnamed protein product [Cladocopium goreaui]|uniref:Potassium channel domain-containing protein n=1 Tax=Cladocopium goreaui TaxID=2562237 RepID=A0A9P1CG97_9DINO|nr:unnamed protein product [Cladocopium goreaui]
MPQRRRVVLASSNELKVAEVSRSLANYDIECVRDAHAAASQDAIWETLHQRGEEFWHKAVFKEEMRVFRAPADGLEGFLARVKDHVPAEDCTELPSDALPDGEADAYELPKDEAAQIREPWRRAATALHTTPGATGDVDTVHTVTPAAGYAEIPVDPAPTRSRHLVHSTYSSAVEGYVDQKQKPLAGTEAFGWDDVVVLTSTVAIGFSLGTGKTYQDMLKLRLKFSPRFSKTISFADSESVASFVAQNEFFNNEVAQRSGLSGVFIAVATLGNNGAFFRSAQSRRELNYWLPGLNAGIPFVAKKDPIHEITFTAHDFGLTNIPPEYTTRLDKASRIQHFLIPDLVFTGNTSINARFADMLFVETLRLSGYSYEWSKRKIHPLFQETGLKPFDGDRQHFFSEMRKLLEANVDLAGAIRATGGLVIPPEFGYTGSSPMLVRSHMVSELEKTDAAQRSCELFRGSLISHLIGPKKAAALIDVAAAIGLRWQQEVVQAEVPSPRHEQRYCLMGSTKKYLELIKQHKGEAEDSSQVLDEPWPRQTRRFVLTLGQGSGNKTGLKPFQDFKAKYMPFFVEDYRCLTQDDDSGNQHCWNMAQRAEEYQRWWQIAAPVVQAGRLDGMDNGIGHMAVEVVMVQCLETVDDHMAAIGVSSDGPACPAEELIPKIFQRVFETRLKPVFDGDGYAMEAPHVRLKNAYVRYLVGQMIIFARYDFLEESHRYAAKLTDLVRQQVENFTEATVETARGLYAQFLRVLLRKSLITPDDYEVYQQICPLFDPVYVFYDEQKDFYTQLAEVQQQILGLKKTDVFERTAMVGHFKVEGHLGGFCRMTCASCAAWQILLGMPLVGAVERAITALDGVKSLDGRSAEISLTLKRAEAMPWGTPGSFKGVPKKSQEDQLGDLDLSSLAEELDLKSLDSIPCEAATAGASPEGRCLVMASVFFHVLPEAFWDKVVLEVEAIEDVGFEASVLNEVERNVRATRCVGNVKLMAQSSTQLRKVGGLSGSKGIAETWPKPGLGHYNATATPETGVSDNPHDHPCYARGNNKALEVRGVVVKDAQNAAQLNGAAIIWASPEVTARLLYDPVKALTGGCQELAAEARGGVLVCRYHEEVLEDPSVATLRRMKQMLLLSLPPTIMPPGNSFGFYCGSIFHEAAWSAALHKAGVPSRSDWIGLVCYQGFAVVFFANLEGWTWDQSLYFGMVTMSTVGYGDLYPTHWYSQLVGILFILVGIVVVFGQIIDLVNLVIVPLFQKSRDLVERLMPAHYVDITGDGTPDFKVPRRRPIFYGKGLAGPILMLLLFQFISAAIFTAVEPEWDLWSAWWYVMVTASTVGYGDQSVNKETLRYTEMIVGVFWVRDGLWRICVGITLWL